MATFSLWMGRVLGCYGEARLLLSTTRLSSLLSIRCPDVFDLAGVAEEVLALVVVMPVDV